MESKDYFSFNIRFNKRKLTKRIMLSIISSFCDRLGITSPSVLEGRQLLQHLCNQNVHWDETVDEELKSQWIKWKMKLKISQQKWVDPLRFVAWGVQSFPKEIYANS